MSLRHRTISVIFLNEFNNVKFGFNNFPPKKVFGTELLLQNIIIRLFTSNKSNGYEPTIGSSLYDIIGRGYQVGQEEILKDDFTFAFKATDRKSVV